MKKIILFGVNGHIGAYTFDYLANNLLKISKDEEYQLIACGRRKDVFWKQHGFEYVCVDICDESSFESLPKNDVYAVVDFAGVMPATMCGYNPYAYIDVNIRGTLNVLEYCRRVKCQKLIMPTTEADLSSYWKPGAKIDPDLYPKFDYSSNYAMYIISRRTVIDMMNSYYAKYGIIPFILRCSTVYCYFEKPFMYKNGALIVPGYLQIYDKAIKGEDIEIWGNPKVKTEIVYVKDFAQIVKNCIQVDNCQGGIYNIGNGMPVSLEDQIKLVVEILGPNNKKSNIIYCPEKPDGRDFVQDITKTCKDLGYKPKYDYKSYLIDYKLESQLNRFSDLFEGRRVNK